MRIAWLKKTLSIVKVAHAISEDVVLPLDLPADAPRTLVELKAQCMDLTAANRPKFAEVHSRISRLLEQLRGPREPKTSQEPVKSQREATRQDKITPLPTSNGYLQQATAPAPNPTQPAAPPQTKQTAPAPVQKEQQQPSQPAQKPPPELIDAAAKKSGRPSLESPLPAEVRRDLPAPSRPTTEVREAPIKSYPPMPGQTASPAQPLQPANAPGVRTSQIPNSAAPTSTSVASSSAQPAKAPEP